MNRLTNEILAAILAGIAFLVMIFILDIGIIAALIVAGVVGGATYFLVPSKKPAEIALDEDTRASVGTGAQKLSVIKGLGRKIQKLSMTKAITDVCTSIQKILDTIQEDPAKLKPSQQFLNYYLDATVNILTKYVDLAGKDVRDAEIQKSLLKVETTLITIKDAFDKQLAKLLSNDAMNLDVEIQVLEQTINSEGLGKNQ